MFIRSRLYFVKWGFLRICPPLSCGKNSKHHFSSSLGLYLRYAKWFLCLPKKSHLSITFSRLDCRLISDNFVFLCQYKEKRKNIVRKKFNQDWFRKKELKISFQHFWVKYQFRNQVHQHVCSSHKIRQRLSRTKRKLYFSDLYGLYYWIRSSNLVCKSIFTHPKVLGRIKFLQNLPRRGGTYGIRLNE